MRELHTAPVGGSAALATACATPSAISRTTLRYRFHSLPIFWTPLAQFSKTFVSWFQRLFFNKLTCQCKFCLFGFLIDNDAYPLQISRFMKKKFISSWSFIASIVWWYVIIYGVPTKLEGLQQNVSSTTPLLLHILLVTFCIYFQHISPATTYFFKNWYRITILKGMNVLNIFFLSYFLIK